MDLGERITPSSVSDLRITLFNVESLSEVRTPLADFFSILLEARSPFAYSILMKRGSSIGPAP